MSRQHTLRALGLAALASHLAWAQSQPPQTPQSNSDEQTAELQPIVVLAAKTGALQTSLGQTVDIVTREQLDAAGYQTVTDALRDVAGVDFRSYGPKDTGSAAISIRGMRPYHTRVLIDGVPIHDQSSTQMGPVLGGLPLNGIDRIEVVKGPSSLQGSSAMGGVINIVTRRPTEDGLHGTVRQELGSHGRSTTGLQLLGKHGPVDYRLDIGRTRERGISAIYRDAYGKVNLDDDHYRAMVYDGRIGLQLDDHWRAELFGRFQNIDEEYDDGYAYGDFVSPDTDDVLVRRALGGALLKGDGLLDGLLDLSLQAAATRADRIYHTLAGRQASRYTGDHREAELKGTLHLTEWLDLTLGTQFEEDQMRRCATGKHRDMNRTHRTASFYLGLQAEPVENLVLNLNGRLVDHSEFGAELVGDASVRYLVAKTGTTLRASAGRGYRTPSLDELYNNYTTMGYLVRGNPDLDPETSISWEAGIEQDIIGKTLRAGIAYFENRIDDYISSVSSYDPDTWTTVATYEQINGVTIRGLESFIAWEPIRDQLTVRLTHTYQRTRNEENGNRFLAYIPRQKLGADVTFRCLADNALSLNLGGVFVGSRWTTDSKADREKLDDYILLHAAAAYKLTKQLELTLRIDNLLNTRYADMSNWGTTYGTYGRTYYAGIAYSF